MVIPKNLIPADYLTQVNYLSALSGGVQFGFLVLVLPIMSKSLISRYDIAAHTKDHIIATCSLIISATGSLLLEFGKHILVAVLGCKNRIREGRSPTT